MRPFHVVLQEVRRLLAERQHGIAADRVMIARVDLQALYDDWLRLDKQLRDNADKLMLR